MSTSVTAQGTSLLRGTAWTRVTTRKPEDSLLRYFVIFILCLLGKRLIQYGVSPKAYLTLAVAQCCMFSYRGLHKRTFRDDVNLEDSLLFETPQSCYLPAQQEHHQTILWTSSHSTDKTNYLVSTYLLILVLVRMYWTISFREKKIRRSISKGLFKTGTVHRPNWIGNQKIFKPITLKLYCHVYVIVSGIWTGNWKRFTNPHTL